MVNCTSPPVLLWPTRRGFRQAGTGAMTARPVPRKKAIQDGDDGLQPAPVTGLGDRLASRIPMYNVEWRRHLSELPLDPAID